ncbi:hypothetical protein MIR68_009317 [Amoeboaphelidium protococcarum]|nr:hypothetical protein MIR68_009317 [Amoeboaphelidium protococcarum]
MTEFFCPFCTKATKIKKDKLVFHLTGKQRGQCQFFVQFMEKDQEEALVIGWMAKQLLSETIVGPYDALVLIDYCKQTKPSHSSILLDNSSSN